ncbi:hypothetical protein NP493_750g00019 [Ridgeia piscesae]|uniref:Uncharacterized protein n=1 Tax=Ridgeia piscesae TaxID=27915 RepID=A0AAD9KPG0_RIDPI|nr:hypothetical protein NP493_750g00019 [Ridgeia piscesae]
MRIKYCHDRQAARSEWSKPWNFCCKRSRCNAKLVEDEPQRVFGMGCRRTEDCVQGHNNRPVCSNYFKSCPHISTGIIKMECRLQARRPVVTGRSVVATRQSPQERRCFCVKNAFPKGPICLSESSRSDTHVSICKSCCSSHSTTRLYLYKLM